MFVTSDINSNKSGMPAATKGGAYWRFSPTTVVPSPPPPPPNTCPATSWRKKSNGYTIYRIYKTARFFLGFMPFSP